MFALVPLLLSNWKPILIAGAVAAGLGWLAWERHELIVQGEQQALEKVKEANDADAAEAAGAAKTVDDCYAVGGTWDRDLGVCKHESR